MNWLFSDPERRKLVWSVAANMLTRVPSLALLFLILPRLFAGLGQELYATMFAALALGGLATFLMGGTGVLGVRLIGSAASMDDRAGEASAFLSLAAVNLSLTLLLMTGAVAVEMGRGEGMVIACIALLPLLQAGLNTTFDNARMAYNEHYRTATLGFCFQVLWYLLILLVPAFTTNILLAATAFHAPTILASLVNGVLLVRARPHLLRGRVTRFRETLRAGMSFGTADGLLMGALGVMVIWLEAQALPSTASWFATQNRLFQMLLTPVLMVLLPLAAFVRIKWAKASPRRQREAIRAAFAIGALGLVGMTLGLGLAGPFYARYWLGLGLPSSWPILFPTFLFFGAITFYRCFASIAYLVLDGAWLAHRVIAASLIAGLAWLGVMPFLDPLASFGVFATVASLLIVAVLAVSVRRTLRPNDRVASAEPMTTDILGVPVAIIDHPRAAARVLDWVRQRQSRYVCVRDVNGIMLAQRDPVLMEIHRSAGLVLPDGMPLVHVARWRGHRSITRVSGPDFVETMADLGRAEGLRHYFYGGKPGVADRMATALAGRFPGLAIAGTSSPSFGEVSEDERKGEIARMLEAAPDIVWIGLGTPKQERWMGRHRDELPGVTLIGVGAAFDFHSGDVRRAPVWMQRATLEWLHRLVSEPRRLWRRYLLLAPAFVWRVLRDKSV